MNNYHIYEEVGRGKYSVVYKGRKKKTIEYVAVKSVERSRRRKLMNEVRIFHNLSHRNILKFYNWYETRNHLWIIFEYCPGGDLYQLIDTDKKLPEDTVKKFGYELVEGLSYLHANGIIFSDLKPSNILINEYNILKLCDFGLSKKLSDLTQPESDPSKPKAGTPYYMAPELFQDNGIHTYYSDFWSLGCLLYELATGKPPFCTNSLKDLISMIVEQDFLKVNDFSREYNDLITKLLEKDPIKRINWDELKSHPFWATGTKKYEFTKRLYPPQPQFDIYLQSRGIVPQHFYDQRNNPLAKKFGQPQAQGAKVDIMRLSHNVRRNMKREEDDESQNQYGQAPLLQSESSTSQYNQSQLINQMNNFNGSQISSTNQSRQQEEDDYKLKNRNMVLNFGDKMEEEETDQKWTPSTGQGSGNSTPHGTSYNLAGKDINFNNSTNQYVNQPSSQQTIIPSQTPLSAVENIGIEPYSKAQDMVDEESQQLFEKVNVMRDPLKKTPNQAIQTPGNQLGLNKQVGGKPQQTNIPPQSTSTNRKGGQYLVDDDQMYGMQPSTNQTPLNVYTAQVQQPVSNQKQAFGFAPQVQQPPQQVMQNNLFQPNPTPMGIPQSQKHVPHQPYAQRDLLLMANQQMFQQNNQQIQQQNQFLATQQLNQVAMSNNSSQLSAQTTNSQLKVPHKTIDQLIIHNSDTAVKPIIGNKEIERQVEITYNAEYLTFEPWSAEQIIQKIDSPQIETHLSDVYNALATNTTINEKINALQYFESIIVNSNVSNRLINSAFMNLLVKMMKTMKSPQIKIRLCSVIGLLIRHSTVIENELAESEICAQLIESMKDKNDKVRKKAIAALGEYLFYAATQLDDEQADPIWEISDEAINVIVKSLRPQEDETVRFYSCKTLENITAQSTSAGHRFASLESVNFLLQIFLTQPTNPQQNQPPQPGQVNDNMRTSAAVALSHICKLNPQLFPVVFDKITPKYFCYTLTEGQSRVQQAFITMLNLAISANSYPKINEILLGEDTFLKSLMRLLEHHSIVIRGKCLLTFLLLFKLDFRWMAIVDTEVKFFHVLDRLTRDTYKYVQCCLLCLAEGIVEIIPQIFKTISEELNILLNGGKTSRIPSDFDKVINRSEFEQLQGNLIYISIILDLQNAQLIKNRIVTYPFIRSIATLIDNCDIYSFQGAEEFLNALLLITESMSSNQKILIQMNEPILTFMLPVLLSKIKSDSADIRFLSLKIFTDIIIQYVHDDTIYDLKGGEAIIAQEGGNNLKVTTKQINDLILKHLFPSFKIILSDNDPVPLFGLKLLAAIIERNPVFVQLLKQFNLFSLIADYYVVNHPRLNRHTIKILKSMIETKELSFQDLTDFKIIDKTHQIIKNMLANKQDWCIEILLDIIHEILSQFNDVVKTKESEISKQIDEIFNNFDICVKLLNLQFEMNIVEKSSQCLIQMLQLYALCSQKKREVYFVESHMQFLISALKTDKKIIQKRVLKCIYWALIQSEYQIRLTSDKRVVLEQQIQVLLQADDRSIGTTSREIYKILQEQNQIMAQEMSGGGMMSQQQQQQQVYMQQQQQMNFYHNNMKAQK